MRNLIPSLTLAALTAAVLAAPAQARDQIRIVGSSTVYPFATVVAETVGKTTRFKTPVIESTGTGGGFKLFCAGAGIDSPDISNASRAITTSEIETCAKNGVKEITEVKFGYDGIVLANSHKAPRMTITRRQLFLALGRQVPVDGALRDNPYRTWKAVDPSLPNVAIKVLGPPPTSGTRDAFAELVMEEGCKAVPGAKELKLAGKACHAIREDGAYVEAGENDILIVRKLEADKEAFGVFGFSFLDQNADQIQGSLIEGVEPTFENIADGRYPVSRPLFFYVKKAHVQAVPGLEAYVGEFTSDKAWGPDGYLAGRGLIPMPEAERTRYRREAVEMMANVKMM